MTDHKTVREALRLAEKKCFDATGRIDLELSLSITQALAALDRIEADTQPHGYDDSCTTNATSGTVAVAKQTADRLWSLIYVVGKYAAEKGEEWRLHDGVEIMDAYN